MRTHRIKLICAAVCRVIQVAGPITDGWLARNPVKEDMKPKVVHQLSLWACVDYGDMESSFRKAADVLIRECCGGADKNRTRLVHFSRATHCY